MHSQTLHYVYFKQQPREQGGRIEYMLRSVTFTEDGKPEIQLDVPLNIRLQKNPTDDSEYLHLPGSRATPDANFHMEVVKIDSQSSCICFQSIDERSRCIVVTVMMNLSRMLRKDYVIPLNNVSPELLNLTRTYFTSIDGMLVMYIPGYYFQLVDCSSDHDPCSGLFVPELAPPLPGIDPETYPNAYVTNFEIYPNDNQLTCACPPPTTTGLCFLTKSPSFFSPSDRSIRSLRLSKGCRLHVLTEYRRSPQRSGQALSRSPPPGLSPCHMSPPGRSCS